MNQKQKEAKALELKAQGNTLYKIKSYESAIQKYNEAITFSNSISILHSNKARCYLQLQQFQQSYKSAEKAVEIDDKNIKAHFMMAQCLVRVADNSKDPSKIEEAIEKLKKSLRLCPSQKKGEFQQKFIEEIYRAKKKLWLLQREANEGKMKALRSYLVGIVENDSSISEEEKDNLHENISTVLQKKFGSKKPIPEALICPISKVLMKEPVCNEHGNSYSKKNYQEELLKNGKIDPLTSKPIKIGVTYANVNLKKAIERFLEENPWAYDESLS